MMYHFIVNPKSRTGKGLDLWEGLEKHLKERKVEYKVHFTEREGHATEFARKICEENEGKKNIVIVGGDGTANETINGLCDHEHIVLGYIPTGSSNDLARGYGISADPEKALNAILSPKVFKKVDHGVAQFLDDGTERRFAVSSGIGYDADICHRALTSNLKKVLNKIKLGKLVYYLIGFREIFSKRPASAEFIIDSTQKLHAKKLVFAANMILPIEGGGMPMAPDADPSDGHIDTCFVRDVSRLTHITSMPLILNGHHTKRKNIDVYRGRTMEIKTTVPLAVHTDGEYAGHHSHVVFRCMPEQILMILG